ncbi:U1 small nuclear ribonucleoprotein component SNU71 [Scheffersomyces xylosifermentans]|uniref:U1 small nuclear ribonucleoprotein component SNU71 n=1 Tax=Scheffersomyces xylosifermentans TaxID=1304137 RepID=UPI00315D2B21
MTTSLEVTVDVAPYSIPESNNSRLLGFLKPLPYSSSKSTGPSVATPVMPSVPVLKDIDVSELVSANNQKLISQVVASRTRTIEDIGVEDDIDDRVLSMEKEDPAKYVDIEAFSPASLKDQVGLIAIHFFPKVKRYAIEKILDSLAGVRPYRWSHVHYEYADNRLVFVQFGHVSDAKWFIETYRGKLAGILQDDDVKMAHSENLFELVKGAEEGSVIPDRIPARINLVLKNPKNFERVSKKTGTEDLDEVLTYYSKYEVDKNDLIDVPTNMKDAIINDIIRFRSKVLLIERDNRKKEIELERQKTKDRLKKLFEGIKEANDDMVVDEAPPAKEPSGFITRNEHDDLNDVEYQEFIEQEEKKKIEDAYVARFAKLRDAEVNEREGLMKQLDALFSYEDDLLDNKFRYIDAFKSIETVENKKGNDIEALSHLYYNNHARYLKERNEKRSAEEALDLKDAEEEKLELESKNYILQKQTEQQTEVEIIEMDDENSQSENRTKISNFSEAQQKALQSKIVELVEEYLGVIDDFLVEVIIDNLNKHDMQAKQQLIEELSEVLDDDAANLVNDLWKFLTVV